MKGTIFTGGPELSGYGGQHGLSVIGSQLRHNGAAEGSQSPRLEQQLCYTNCFLRG